MAGENIKKSSSSGVKTDILKEYGNNYFELWTYDLSSPNRIKLSGILKDLPELCQLLGKKVQEKV